MPGTEDTIPVQREIEQCPHCHEVISSGRLVCEVCGYSLVSDLGPKESLETGVLRRKPTAHARPSAEIDYFGDDMTLILQVLPSGTCVAVQAIQPVVLGRQHPGAGREFCDLTDFSAAQHGVSRHHCLLRRVDHRLLVSDLHSSNGTYLNGLALPPLEEYPLAHGDKLILGTLHLIVIFVTH